MVRVLMSCSATESEVTRRMKRWNLVGAGRLEGRCPAAADAAEEKRLGICAELWFSSAFLKFPHF